MRKIIKIAELSKNEYRNYFWGKKKINCIKTNLKTEITKNRFFFKE